MDIEQYIQPIIEYVRVHQAWAAPIVFVLCFAESLAFISLLVPAWAALVGIGTIIGASNLNFWPIWIAGSLGAACGDWLSYWVGLKLESRVYRMWPLSQHPEIIPAAEAFIRKWGAFAIFIGRFSGPLRASVPLVAGVFAMPYWRFQIANFTSAFVWAGTLLTLGDVTSTAIKWLAKMMGA
jgi:membrane protein DedA with SNARE-associated domain